jgi:SOS-response transcriptional repressor LexA
MNLRYTKQQGDDIMSYAKLLNSLIEKSGMTAKEIAKQCTEQGQKITASYLSILRNADSKRIPSDDISRALAKVLGVDENRLLLEAYLDNAPPLLKTALKNIYYIATQAAASMLGSEITESQHDNLRKIIDELPLSDIVIELAKNKHLNFYDNFLITKEKVDNTTYNMQIQLDLEFDVLDNAMEPKLPKGSRVKIKMQNEYKSGDVVAFKEKDNEKIQYRKLDITKKGEQLLVAFHSDYNVLEYDANNMVILGRVHAVTNQL